MRLLSNQHDRDLKIEFFFDIPTEHRNKLNKKDMRCLIENIVHTIEVM